ncbi:MAG TPA: hypothetical protein VH439_17430 [Gemmatimonadales bacterium]
MPIRRSALDLALLATGRRMTALGDQLRAGEITGAAWALEMRALIKDVHLYSAAAAKGGWDALTPADFGRIGQLVKAQYQYLNRFAGQIADGLVLDGHFRQRVILYAEAGRGTYYTFTQDVMRDRGMTEEMNVLHPADHCVGCLAETARGWVPLGELVPVGARECLGRCKCTITYR